MSNGRSHGAARSGALLLAAGAAAFVAIVAVIAWMPYSRKTMPDPPATPSERAVEIATERLRTLPRYQEWQQEGRSYTTRVSPKPEEAPSTNMQWTVVFDMPDVEDQAIRITVDTATGAVTNVDVHME